MKVSTPMRVGGGVVVILAVLWCWYMVAADYSYRAVSGTYLYQGDGESSTLVLRQDQSFQQDLNRDGKMVRAQGTWRRVGEGGVVFSKEFLKVKYQEVRGDGQADGQIENRALPQNLWVKRAESGPWKKWKCRKGGGIPTSPTAAAATSRDQICNRAEEQ